MRQRRWPRSLSCLSQCTATTDMRLFPLVVISLIFQPKSIYLFAKIAHRRHYEKIKLCCVVYSVTAQAYSHTSTHNIYSCLNTRFPAGAHAYSRYPIENVQRKIQKSVRSASVRSASVRIIDHYTLIIAFYLIYIFGFLLFF